ncbi:MAG TPA: FGGY family carbohydrate kinase [Candidatus Methylomirabilis sp.]|nr:FGGY family carbohydrate kinase [Candidatus Methylomirabilis sp.]
MGTKEPLLLGLDIGTSGGRAVLFDVQGRPAAQASRAWSPSLPRPDWAELDAEAVWKATVQLLRELAGGAEMARVAGVGISSQLTTLCLDQTGSPVLPAFPWLDRRAAAEAAEIEAEAGREVLARIAGRRAAGERPAAICRWLQRHEPAAWSRVASVCTVKDFLALRLTGRLATDEPHASYSLLFDVAKRRWDADLPRLVDVARSCLPEVLPSPAVVGTVRTTAAGETGLPAGIPVVAGGPDGTLAALGAGLTRPGIAADVAGTTDVVFACLDRPKMDPGGGVVTNAHACPGRWLLGGPTTTTGGALTWFAEHVAGTTDLAILYPEAAGVPAGADGLLCLPALVGERTPIWDPRARGAFVGLTLAHRRGHLARAVLEGCACVVRRVVEAIVRMGEPVREVRLVGGAARSDLWSQIRADVLGLPILRMPVREASALGAAILAAVGAGCFSDVASAAEKMSGAGEPIRPRCETHARYNEVFAAFERLDRMLRGMEVAS